jgi:hypothetical protein
MRHIANSRKRRGQASSLELTTLETAKVKRLTILRDQLARSMTPEQVNMLNLLSVTAQAPTDIYLTRLVNLLTVGDDVLNELLKRS